jgi:tetrahydromethanopterin S-methyltransferase subunit C
MAETVAKPTALRVAASVILGVIVGGILFLIVTFFIAMINRQYLWIGIPIDLQITENVISLGLLILLIGFSIAYFWWKVETTPPSIPESPEIPESEIPDE